MIWSTSHPQAVADGWLTDGAVVKEGSARRRIARISLSRGSTVARTLPAGPLNHTVPSYNSRRSSSHYNVNMSSMKEDILGFVTVYVRL